MTRLKTFIASLLTLPQFYMQNISVWKMSIVQVKEFLGRLILDVKDEITISIFLEENRLSCATYCSILFFFFVFLIECCAVHRAAARNESSCVVCRDIQVAYPISVLKMGFMFFWNSLKCMASGKGKRYKEKPLTLFRANTSDKHCAVPCSCKMHFTKAKSHKRWRVACRSVRMQWIQLYTVVKKKMTVCLV